MKFFCDKEFFFMNFDFKNGCKNELKNNNEKSCRWSSNRVSHKINLKVQWPHNGDADSVEVKTFQKINLDTKKLPDSTWLFPAL